jgi:glyoxylase-like metal-dependent hydrolase (beta-lactamase superfamily II)
VTGERPLGRVHGAAAGSSDWFHVAEVEPGVHLVSEPGHVNCWLVAGRDRSVLVDTGLGLVPIRPSVEAVATSDLLAVISHAHFDHVGGNAELDEVLAHELAPPILARGVPQELLGRYAAEADGLAPAWERLREAERGFHLLGPDERVRPWPPAGVDLAGWRIEAPPPTGLLRDGDRIDLGGRELTVLHTPGHAPDHICLLDERAGILFAQDQAYYGPHLVYFEDSDVEAWARSARRLAGEVASSVRVVYCAHVLRFAAPPRLLAELAAAGEEVAAGEATLVPAEGFLGAPVLEADYGHFSVQVPRDRGAIGDGS